MKYAVKCGKLYLALMENGGKEERCEDSRKQLRKLKKEFPNTVSETRLSKKIGATGFEPATSRGAEGPKTLILRSFWRVEESGNQKGNHSRLTFRRKENTCTCACKDCYRLVGHI